MGKPVSRKGAGLALPSNCAGTQLSPGDRRCFLSKMQRWDRMGHLFFFRVIHQLGNRQCCLATKSALAPGCPNPPSTGPQGTLGLLVGWYSMQGTEEGLKSAFSHPESSGACSAFL